MALFFCPEPLAVLLLRCSEAPEQRAGFVSPTPNERIRAIETAFKFNHPEDNERIRDFAEKGVSVKRLYRGTTFFGGAGMEGEYINDMVEAMKEAGIKNARAADKELWSKGIIKDAMNARSERKRDDEPSDLSRMGKEGKQFNLVGYSYGGLQAAQAAADHADEGGYVDNLVLVGTPIDKTFLAKLQSHPDIGGVRVIDLTKHGDPIKAGMSGRELLKAVPELQISLGLWMAVMSTVGWALRHTFKHVFYF